MAHMAVRPSEKTLLERARRDMVFLRSGGPVRSCQGRRPEKQCEEACQDLCTPKIEMIFPKQGEWRVQAPAIGTDEVGGRLNRILVSAAATRTREFQ